jgi:S-adenosylmethionine synthetase
VDLFLRQRHTGAWLANDTSCGVGHAPPTPLQRSVRAVADRLAWAAEREGRVEVGEDVKVMGVRHGHHVRLTVACAFVGRHLDDVEGYLAAKARVKRLAEEAAASVPGGEGTVDVNTGDDPRHGAVYLTVTGTSAEGGDDGQVGRGNRCNGLITPFAPMSLEAAAGKNPVTHVGKLYNLAASRIASAVVATVPGVESAQCFLVSQIGRPISDPQAAEVHVSLAPGQHVALVRPRIQELVREHVSRVDTLWQDVLAGDAPAY